MSEYRDVFMVLGFFIVLWVAWVSTGGPERALMREGGGGFGSVVTPITGSRGGERGTSRDPQAIREQFERARVEGTASPYQGLVSFSGGDPDNRIAQFEYVRLRATGRKDAEPILITGWQLESLVTGIRIRIPAAAPLPLSGSLNAEAPLFLEPGDTALINSGRSPLGVSFRLNSCSGYLDQFQRFAPRLPKQCPNPEDELEAFGGLPITSIRSEDDEFQACFDYIDRNIRRCELHTENLRARDVFGNDIIDPPLSDQCIAFIQNDLTYNGCVENNRLDADFFDDEWRVYLGSFGELWREEKEILRLLDAEGRVVDVWQY